MTLRPPRNCGSLPHYYLPGVAIMSANRTICCPSGCPSTTKEGTPRMVMRKLGLAAFLSVACAGFAEAKHVAKHSRHSGHTAEHNGGGLASVYGSSRDGYAGGRTASGERVQSGALTAAHRSLPFGTWVRVNTPHNTRTAVVG